MRTVTTLAIVATLVLLAGGAGAKASYSSEYGFLFDGAPQEFEARFGPRSVILEIRDITVEGQSASHIRQYIDTQFNEEAGSDPDGTVSAREVEMAEIALQLALNEVVKRDIEIDAVTIDGHPSSSILVADLNLGGATGDVASTAAVEGDISLKITYSGVDTTLGTHHVEMRNVYASFALQDTYDDEYPVEVAIRTISDWGIVRDTIEPPAAAEKYSDGAIRLTNEDAALFDEQGEGVSFDIHGDPDVTDEEDDENFLPLPGLLAAAALVGAASLRRRL